MAVLVGIRGTTILLTCFFGRPSQEVEEDRKHGKTTVAQRHGSTNLELSVARNDVFTGMLFSNLIMFFIIPHHRRRPARAWRGTSKRPNRRPKHCGR